jgi:hypothetical protein
MNNYLPQYILLPALFTLLQTVIILWITMILLRRIKWINASTNEIEYGDSFVAAAVLLGVMLIQQITIPHAFQAAKLLQDQSNLSFNSVWLAYLPLFGMTWLIILVFCLFCFLSRLVVSSKKSEQALPHKIILSILIISLALTCRAILAEWLVARLPGLPLLL